MKTKAERKLFCAMYDKYQSCCSTDSEGQEYRPPVDYLAVANETGIDAAKANTFVFRWQKLKLLSIVPP
jgi:hypothetical protein